MTSHDIGRPITVGVADDQHAALAFAAREARLAGTDIRVVHAYVVPPSPPQVMGTAYGFDIDRSFRESGREVLAGATDFLAQQDGGLVVHPVLMQGPAPDVLFGASSTSRLMVLGPDDARPWYSRLFQSRVARKLADGAPCPVVVVPDAWTAQDDAQGVTLLLDGRSVADGPLRFAFEHAARHGAVLHVVHLRPADSPHADESSWHEARRLTDSCRATYPRVRVTTTVISGDADPATVSSLERTGLLVLGRPHEHRDVAALHRSLARSVIEHASCPVAIVPPDHDI
jgi:nucleotide-binding universal stress UspA family protein